MSSAEVRQLGMDVIDGCTNMHGSDLVQQDVRFVVGVWYPSATHARHELWCRFHELGLQRSW